MNRLHGLNSLLVDHSTRAPLRLLLIVVLLLVIAATHARAADPAPQGSPAGNPSAPRLPVLGAHGPPTKIDGKIARSSRGRKGPVRLLVERTGGEKVTVLVAPDDYCDRVGLSLRNGESVVVEGSMLKGERPILIATTITSDGKTVKIRDAEGKLLEQDKGATGGATGGGQATLSGPVPTATPK